MATKTTAPSSLSNIASGVSNIAAQAQKGFTTQASIDSAKAQLASLSSKLESGKNSGAYQSGVDYAELDRPTQMAGAATEMLKERANTAAITPADVVIPTPKVPVFKDTANWAGALAGLEKGADINQIIDKSADIGSQTMQKMYELIGTPPSTADQYADAQRQAGIVEKQQKVNDLSAQLNQITAQSQANQLSTVGQGRGIPEAIIGGQQAQFAREAAIQALPVSAQLQAAQGNLESAERNLNTLFQLKAQDAQNQYNYRKEVVKSIYDLADKQEQRKLDYAMKLDDRKYQEGRQNDEIAQSYAQMAVKGGQASLAGQFAKLDGSSPTFKQDLARLAGQVYSPDTAIVKLDNGNTVVVDSRSGRVINTIGGAKAASAAPSFVITKPTVMESHNGSVVSAVSDVINKSGAKPSETTNAAINVIAGLEQLVKDAPKGEFTGLSPFVRLPDIASGKEALTNRSNIEAINLKVQQWASGAALTDAQTAQVEKITPKRSDTDSQVRAKTNALANYMVSQVRGQLAGQGVDFAMDNVDMFTKTPEQELAELYKVPTMQETIKKVTQMFPTYTDAEILQIIK